MPRKSTKKLASDRIVYAVTTPQKGTHQVEAENSKELKAALTPLLPLDPYSVQAIAHLMQTEQAAIQGTNWSIKRLGKMAFIPDEDTHALKPVRQKKASTAQESRNTETRVAVKSPQPQFSSEGGGSERLSFGDLPPAPRQAAATADAVSTNTTEVMLRPDHSKSPA